MATNCDAACLVTAPSFSAIGCDPKAAIRTGYISHLIFTRCDTPVPDITDDTAIAALVAAGTMFVTPALTGELPVPTFGDEITENCQTPISLKRTWNLTANSVRTDVSGLTDFADYNTLDQSLNTWFMTWYDCDGNVFVPQDFATDQEMGFQTNGQISPLWDNSSSMKWQFDLSWNYNQIPQGIALTAAVKTALGL